MDKWEDWGLTPRGFRRPSYTELLDAFEYKARELFPARTNLTVRSPLGMLLRIFAWFTSLLFGVLEDVYNSRFADTAVGTSLFNLGRSIGQKLISNQRAKGYLEITGAPGIFIPAGWLAANTAGLQFVVAQDGTIGDSGVIVLPAQAVTPGEDSNLPPHTITTIVNPVIPAGVENVTNPNAFKGGRLRETDEQFRDRYYKTVDKAGGVNADAIRAAILQDVEGCIDAEVFENDTDFHDPVTGLPPHSIEAVVFGGLDQDIAAVIKERKAGGIETFGDIAVMVPSVSNRQLFEIRFNRPEPVPVWVQLWDLVTDSSFPNNGVDLVRSAVVDYIGSTTSGGVGIGESLRYKWLSAALVKGKRAVPGLRDFEMKISADGVTYGYANIPVSLRQKVVSDESKVIILGQ